MSANLSLPDLDDELMARLQDRADRHGQSAAAEAREILRLALLNEPGDGARFDELAARMRALTAGRPQTPSEVLLRESREER